MRKVIQKRIVEVIQPEIVQYFCDKCGKRCGTRENPKTIIHNLKGKTKHYCKNGCYRGDKDE